MTDINKEDELAKAYAEDLLRKQEEGEDDGELKAAKDYLKVLLSEAEDRTEELEGSNRYADELQQRLAHTEEEIELLKQQGRLAEDNSRRGIRAWIIFAVIELVIIAGLIVAIMMNFKLSDRDTTTQPLNVTVTGDSPAPQESEPVTGRYVEDLELRASYISKEAIAPFTVETHLADGLEYLVFTYKDIKVSYKNEYYLAEKDYRKLLIIDNGEEKIAFAGSYDLSGDLAELCPEITSLSGRDYLVFTEYQRPDRTGIPSCIRAIDMSSMRVYKTTSLEDQVLDLMFAGLLEEPPVIEGTDYLIQLSTARASYKYAVTEGYYNDLAYTQDQLLRIEEDFVFTAEKTGLSWSSYVKLGDDLYLGSIDGKLIPSGNELVLSGSRYCSFAPANIEDAELQGNILPLREVPDRVYTVSGYNNEKFLITIDETLPLNEYYWENLNTEEASNWLYYDADGNLVSHKGIDVSKYQETIDWAKVAADGVEFAIIRLGYRGMNEGTLELDPYFKTNAQEAAKQGIKVGVYFFSQAINEKEGIEEADFVLNIIKDYKISYPVVFDTERITTYDARGNKISLEQRTDACIAFCERIAAAGYKPMIYANTKYMLMGIDLSRLTAYDKWFAHYSTGGRVSFPYDFQIFQYTESGSIDGVKGGCDVNISFVDYDGGR